MRFAAVYRNTGDVRTQALKLLYGAINGGMDLSVSPLRHPVVSTMTEWPSLSFLLSLPITSQCEEMEYKDGKFKTLRLLVIDVEVAVVEEILPLTNPQT